MLRPVYFVNPRGVNCWFAECWVFGQYFGSYRVNARQLRLDKSGGDLGLSVLTDCVSENGTMGIIL